MARSKPIADRGLALRHAIEVAHFTNFLCDGSSALDEPKLSGRHIGWALVFKIRQIDPTIGFPLFSARLSAPEAIIRKTVQ